MDECKKLFLEILFFDNMSLLWNVRAAEVDKGKSLSDSGAEFLQRFRDVVKPRTPSAQFQLQRS